MVAGLPRAFGKKRGKNKSLILLRNIRKSLRRSQFNARRRESKLRRRLDAAPPVLVYQMGKVGSSSLKVSLSQTWPGLTVQAHNILKDIEPVVSRPQRAFEFNQIERKEGVRLIYDRVIRRGAPLFIITPVREPIGRNISAFFQNFERYTGVKHRASTFSIDELIDIFLRTHSHEIPVTWFDEHFKPIFGLDVYGYNFPSTGIQVIEHNNAKLLLMQCELANSIKEAAVREFLNLPDFTLSDSNVGSEKEYAETYRRFTEAFIAPDWYVRDMYETRFFTHFYDEIHRKNCVKKWQKNVKPQEAEERS